MHEDELPIDATLPTGLIVELFLDESPRSLAERLTIDPDWFQQFIDGLVPLTPHVARLLAEELDTDDQMLMTMDHQYWDELSAGKTRM